MLNSGRERKFIAIGALLFVYFVLRVIFREIPFLKSLFIYPTGVIVEGFYGAGSYISPEWIYYIGDIRFVLGDSCSGTTFFSLLVAYLVYSNVDSNVSLRWLLFAYPITLLANSMRVMSSMYTHSLLAGFQAQKFGDLLHVMTGVTTFLTCLLVVALVVNKNRSDQLNV